MTILWFGIYKKDFGRNKIYMEALKSEGHIILECQDSSPGLLKYIRLWLKHKSFIGKYDVIFVGYPGHIVTLLARLISRKKIIVDMLGSLYDAEIHSHNPSFLRKIKSQLADYLALKYSDQILLETEAQKKYFSEKFGSSDRYYVVYTGVDKMFERSEISLLNKSWLVVFRGKLTPECGILYILQAAEMLKKEKHIKFRIIGSGYFLNETEDYIRKHDLFNVELISQRLDDENFVRLIQEGNIMLGQFENNPRLNRTIPHKAFEAFASSIPYVTANVPAIREIVEDSKNGFLVPVADSQTLAAKILSLVDQSDLCSKVAKNAHKMYLERFSGQVLAQKLLNIIML